jgi:2-C-methyl-D-erythritol 4-phosphate cytidylyltransferase
MFAISMQNKFVIIVAGGSGNRMKSIIPKQFLLLNGKEIIIHTIEKFLQIVDAENIVVVISQNQKEKWNELFGKFSFLQKMKIAFGGETRFESVKNGLEKINEDGVVAIHDAVRPFASVELIHRCFDDATLYGSGIAAIKFVDTVRQKINDEIKLIDRNHLWQMQTPQCFDVKKIKSAYQNAHQNNFTDDAEVFAQKGFQLHFTEGEKNNFKITTPEDIEFAEWIQKK